ncbi:MAG: ABC transporter substrate-binding protein [Chloroflexota bacterium]
MQDMKKVVALLIVLLLALAACVDQPQDTGEEEPAAPPTEAPAEEPEEEVEEPVEEPQEEPTEEPEEEPAEEPEEEAEEPTEEPEEASEEEEAAEEGEPIYIGGIHPLTGALASDGTQMDNAIRLAIADINEAGGVLDGRQLEYLSADSTGSAEVGQTEAERLIGDGAVALICCFQSAVTSNVAAISEREEVPLVIDVAVADSILQQGYNYTFRIQPNATAMGVQGADFLQEIAEATGTEISTIAYLYEGTSGFGESVRAAFVARAEELGYEIVDEVSYDPFNVTDLTTEMTRLNALAPDILAVTGYYNDGLLAARNAEEVGLDVQAVYGVAQGTYDVPQFVEDAGDLAQCFMDSNYHYDASNPDAMAVRERFSEEYGEEMRTAAVLSYEATRIIAAAIDEAGSDDPAAIRDAIAGISFDGHLLPYDGPIEFDDAGETVNAIPIVMQVQDDAVRQVWPTEVAESDPLMPCVSWQE